MAETIVSTTNTTQKKCRIGVAVVNVYSAQVATADNANIIFEQFWDSTIFSMLTGSRPVCSNHSCRKTNEKWSLLASLMRRKGPSVVEGLIVCTPLP